jgi:hypothetical protein
MAIDVFDVGDVCGVWIEQAGVKRMLFNPLAPLRLPEPEVEPTPEIGPAESSLECLRAVYRSPGQPVARRMRAAIACLPFEVPKLSVTANINGNGFAAELERAYERSRAAQGFYIEGEVVEAEG